MKRRSRVNYSVAQRSEIWDRWQADLLPFFELIFAEKFQFSGMSHWGRWTGELKSASRTVIFELYSGWSKSGPTKVSFS